MLLWNWLQCNDDASTHPGPVLQMDLKRFCPSVLLELVLEDVFIIITMNILSWPIKSVCLIKVLGKLMIGILDSAGSQTCLYMQSFSCKRQVDIHWFNIPENHALWPVWAAVVARYVTPLIASYVLHYELLIHAIYTFGASFIIYIITSYPVASCIYNFEFKWFGCIMISILSTWFNIERYLWKWVQRVDASEWRLYHVFPSGRWNGNFCFKRVLICKDIAMCSIMKYFNGRFAFEI